MSKTFNELVFEQLEKDRSVVVVDTAHAYGIIQKRLKAFWDAVCLTEGTSLESGPFLLESLVALASILQHISETLKFVGDSQDSPDEAYAKAIELNKELKEALLFLLKYTREHIIQLPQIQLGQKRFAVEVDATYLQQMRLIEKRLDE